MSRIIGVIDVACLGDDPSPVAREIVEPAQEPPRLSPAREQAEVVPEHDDRVEHAERVVDVLDSADAGVVDPSPAAHLNGPGRDVDADDVEPALLKMKADAAGTAADVEHTTADKAHRAPVVSGPAAERREIEIPRRTRVDETVVTLDDLSRSPALERGAHQLSPGVFVAFHASRLSSVGSPRRRRGRT
jgi:hypothetical protein